MGPPRKMGPSHAIILIDDDGETKAAGGNGSQILLRTTCTANIIHAFFFQINYLIFYFEKALKVVEYVLC